VEGEGGGGIRHEESSATEEKRSKGKPQTDQAGAKGGSSGSKRGCQREHSSPARWSQ